MGYVIDDDEICSYVAGNIAIDHLCNDESFKEEVMGYATGELSVSQMLEAVDQGELLDAIGISDALDHFGIEQYCDEAVAAAAEYMATTYPDILIAALEKAL